MKKAATLIILSLLLVLQGWTQKSYEIEVHNLVQLNETEFTFDVRMRNTNPAEPFAIETIQWQLSLDDFRNGGILDNAFLTYVANSSELEGEVVPSSTGFTTNVSNTVLQMITPIIDPGEQTTYFGDGDWKRIGTFKLQLRNAANSGFLNFADMHHGLDFISSGVLVFHCNFTESGGQYFRSGNDAWLIESNTLTNGLSDRQLAGYWFEGDGNWDDSSLWNNVTSVNANTLPGANSNAIINGNVTIQDGLDVSLLPDGDGNGGEVTVLTGEAVLYTLTGTIVHTGAGGIVNIWSDGVGSTNLGNPVNLEAGTTVTLQAVDFNFPPNVSWTTDPANSGLFGNPNAYVTTFTMPANNVEAIATTSYKKLSIIENHSKGSKGLYASLTISPGGSLIVDKLFNDSANGADAIIVKSDEDGFGYLINHNHDVLATIELFFADTIYHYVSPPIVDAEYVILQDDGNPANVYSDFWQWNEVLNVWENLNPPHALPTDLMTEGRGYAVAFNPGDQTRVFAGELNTGDIQYAATYTEPWNQQGINLVGNPYPSPIDADIFIADNPSLLGGLYFWDQTEQYDGERWDYATYTLAGATIAGGDGNEPNGFIAPMQGFMIRADEATDIVFNNDQRTTDYAYFFKDGEDKSRIWLSVVGPEGDYNEVLAAFHSTGEMGVDRSDAIKIKGNDKLALYMILDDDHYVIQGLPPFDPFESYTLPLGLDAGFSGEYTFSARKIENFDPDIEIFLEDREAGVFFDLNGSGNYKVAIDEGDIIDRFYLHINGSTSVPVIQPQKSTKVYAIDNVIYLQHSANGSILDVEVVNTLGQTVVSAPVNASEATINVPGRNVVYIVKVRTSEGVESHKVLIR